MAEQQPQEAEPQEQEAPEQKAEESKQQEPDYKKLLEEEQVESGRTIRELTQERDVLTQQLEQLKSDSAKELKDIMAELEELREYKVTI